MKQVCCGCGRKEVIAMRVYSRPDNPRMPDIVHILVDPNYEIENDPVAALLGAHYNSHACLLCFMCMIQHLNDRSIEAGLLYQEKTGANISIEPVQASPVKTNKGASVN